MDAIYISAFFGRYIESWEKNCETNPSWQKRAGSYEFHSKNGYVLTMRFSKKLSITSYECKKQSKTSNKVKDFEEFFIGDGWLRMWGKQTISPDELIIATEQDYQPQLINMGWKKGDNGVILGPTGELFENREDGSLNYFSVFNPGPVNLFSQRLKQLGLLALTKQINAS